MAKPKTLKPQPDIMADEAQLVAETVAKELSPKPRPPQTMGLRPKSEDLV